MISRIKASLLLFFLTAWFTSSDASEALATALENVQVVDSALGQVVGSRCIRVEGDRIALIAEAGNRHCLNDARVRDLSGRYALPGLIDMHAHLTLGPVEIRREDGRMAMVAEANDDIAEHNANRLIAYGVTTIRNPGGDLEAAARYKSRRARGELIGPESFDAGKVINRSADIRGLTAGVTSPEDVRQQVAEQAAAGADWIKLYAGLSPELLHAGIEAAHQHGLPAIGHLDRIAWPEALDMGLDSIVHLMPISPDLLDEESRRAWRASARPGTFAFFEWWEHFDPDGPGAERLIDSFEQHRPVFDATLIAFHAAFVQDLDNIYKDDSRRLAHSSMLANWEDWFTFAVGWQMDDFERARAIWPRVQRMAKRIYTGNARVTIGTDLGNPWVAPGISMHREMTLLAEAGVPLDRVLAAATVHAAGALGAGDRLGRIMEGFEADLIVLDANPLDDIAHTQAIHAVVLDGRWLDSARLSRLSNEGEQP